MTQITDRLAEADALAVYSELVIEAMAEAGMNDPTHDPDLPGWLVDRYDGVRVVDRQRYVMAIVNPDEERLRLVVTNLYGAEHVGLDFPATPIGLAMFVAAARAA